MIVVKNPVSSMPTACWAVAWGRYWMLPSQSTSDRCLSVGAMFASILTTCSHSTKEWEVLKEFDFSTLFALFSLSRFVGLVDLIVN